MLPPGDFKGFTLSDREKIVSDAILFGRSACLVKECQIKHVPIKDIYKMNTTVTINYSSGDTREFVASDELEKLINEGEMFSVSTMHSDMSIDEEMQLSKMYAGNPMSALGNIMIMRRNAKQMSDEDLKDEVKGAIVEILTACAKLLSDELTSHQSGMSPVVVDEVALVHKDLEKDLPECCYLIDCDQCSHQSNENEECITEVLCEHYEPIPRAMTDE